MSTTIQASKRELRGCTENEGLGRPQRGPTSNCNVKPPILVPHKALTFCTPDPAYDRAQKVRRSMLQVILKLNHSLFHYAHFQVNGFVLSHCTHTCMYVCMYT